MPRHPQPLHSKSLTATMALFLNSPQTPVFQPSPFPRRHPSQAGASSSVHRQPLTVPSPFTEFAGFLRNLFAIHFNGLPVQRSALTLSPRDRASYNVAWKRGRMRFSRSGSGQKPLVDTTDRSRAAETSEHAVPDWVRSGWRATDPSGGGRQRAFRALSTFFTDLFSLWAKVWGKRADYSYEKFSRICCGSFRVRICGARSRGEAPCRHNSTQC
jgi:hypothetical protein